MSRRHWARGNSLSFYVSVHHTSTRHVRNRVTPNPWWTGWHSHDRSPDRPPEDDGVPLGKAEIPGVRPRLLRTSERPCARPDGDFPPRCARVLHEPPGRFRPRARHRRRTRSPPAPCQSQIVPPRLLWNDGHAATSPLGPPAHRARGSSQHPPSSCCVASSSSPMALYIRTDGRRDAVRSSPKKPAGRVPPWRLPAS